jgi:multicomponent K+:H+ antiporter subunit E
MSKPAAILVRTRRKLFPHAMLSGFMVILWLLLTNEVNNGQIVLGILLAWLIPFLTQSFWPESIRLHKPVIAVKFVLLVLWDIVVANVILMVRVLSPVRKLKPAFLIVPLEIEHEFAITILASTISLTPGTVSADLDMQGGYLIVHALHVDDPVAAVADIKQRYEAPIKEIFECLNN